MGRVWRAVLPLRGDRQDPNVNRGVWDRCWGPGRLSQQTRAVKYPNGVLGWPRPVICSANTSPFGLVYVETRRAFESVGLWRQVLEGRQAGAGTRVLVCTAKCSPPSGLQASPAEPGDRFAHSPDSPETWESQGPICKVRIKVRCTSGGAGG